MADTKPEKAFASYDETNVDHDNLKDQELATPLSDVEQKKLMRKIDIHLLPFVSLLYLLSFL